MPRLNSVQIQLGISRGEHSTGQADPHGLTRTFYLVDMDGGCFPLPMKGSLARFLRSLELSEITETIFTLGLIF